MRTVPIDRRAFLHDCVRGSLACGLTAAGALLAWRRWRNGACANPRVCRGCGSFAACPLRQMSDERQP